MVISPGKIITIRKNGTKIPENFRYPLTLSTELTIQLKSTFEQLLSSDNKASQIFQLAGQTIRRFTGSNVSFTGQFKELGYKIWSGTAPVQFSFETMLTMKTSGKQDVLDPAKTLMSLCLPSEGSFENGQIGLVAPGPSIFTAAEGKLGSTNNQEKYSIAIGSFYLPNIIIESVEPTFSSDVDSDGYPIWCQLKFDVSSISTATTDLINNFGGAFYYADETRTTL